jgi:hypothetical protein
LPRRSGKPHIVQTAPTSAERRRAKRYRMSTAVVFHWSGPGNKRFRGEGATRDMSVDSVFVLTATCPPANAVVHMEVVLPLSDSSSKAEMRAEMLVMRVDHDVAGINRSGFSAVGKGFMLRTYSERASRSVTDLIKESEAGTDEEE